MTKTCRYRRRGKICKRPADVTLLGYGTNQIKHKRVLLDTSVQCNRSYCWHCANLINARCASTMFVDENGTLVSPAL